MYNLFVLDWYILYDIKARKYISSLIHERCVLTNRSNNTGITNQIINTLAYFNDVYVVTHKIMEEGTDSVVIIDVFY